MRYAILILLFAGVGAFESVAAGEGQPAQAALSDKVIVDTLKAKRASLAFSDTPLTEVMSQIGKLAKANVVFDPAASKDVRITLEVIDLPLEQSLEWVMSYSNLSYVVKGGVIFVTTVERAVQTDAKLQAYDVSELVRDVRDYPGPIIEPGQILGGSRHCLGQ